jgi:GMP synthase-like glutamine amidotransferase
MGGPMGVYDEDKYSWLNSEKEFIKNAIQSDKTVLGVCLGAQLIASSLGAKVYPNAQKEIGWFPISTATADHLLSENSDPFPVFHWHGDTFDLPANAIRIASSEACLNQAFLFSEKIIGLQFHFEVTKKSLQNMIIFCGDELVAGRYIQSADELLSKKHFVSEINERMYHLLNGLESKEIIDHDN